VTPLLIALAIFAFTLPLPLILQLLIAAVLPLLVGLVTNRVTSSAKKAILLLVLSIAAAGLNDLLTSVKADQSFDAGLWLLGAVATFLTSGAFHLILWKPTGVAAAAQDAIPATQPSGQVLEADPASEIPGTLEQGRIIPQSQNDQDVADAMADVLKSQHPDTFDVHTENGVTYDGKGNPLNPRDLDGDGRDDTNGQFV